MNIRPTPPYSILFKLTRVYYLVLLIYMLLLVAVTSKLSLIWLCAALLFGKWIISLWVNACSLRFLARFEALDFTEQDKAYRWTRIIMPITTIVSAGIFISGWYFIAIPANILSAIFAIWVIWGAGYRLMQLTIGDFRE
jgi:hypothetical protein